MKKFVSAAIVLAVLASACSKQYSTGSSGNSHPKSGVAEVSDVSQCMQVSAASFSISDSVNIIFSAPPTDSVCWTVIDDSTLPIIDPLPPGDSTGSDTGVAGPPIFVDSIGWLPVDTTPYPPIDTVVVLPPSDSIYVGIPIDSVVAWPGGDSVGIAPVYVGVCNNLNAGGIHQPGYYANPQCAMRISGAKASFRLRKAGSFAVVAKAYTRLSNGSYALHKTGYVRISLHP